MRIGRTTSPEGSQYIVSPEGSKGWTSTRSLGWEATDIGSLIPVLPDLSAALSGIAPEFDEDVVLLSPITRPGKVLAVGHNYRAHIAEVGKSVPAEPYIFAKYSSSLTGPNAPITYPAGLTHELDYECELAVVIGTEARHVPPESAMSFVLGYAIANDVSARDLQRSLGQISLSKGIDGFCPFGPWVTTTSGDLDPGALEITTRVNGEIRQASTTSDMVFSVADIISYLSRFVTLHPGDIILTGTPAGVGMGFSPPKYLLPGDVIECQISGLGRLVNPVVAGPTVQPD